MFWWVSHWTKKSFRGTSVRLNTGQEKHPRQKCKENRMGGCGQNNKDELWKIFKRRIMERWSTRRKRANGTNEAYDWWSKASEIMADNKLHILNAQRTPTRINFEVFMRHLIFRHQGYKYKVLDDRRYTIT